MNTLHINLKRFNEELNRQYKQQVSKDFECDSPDYLEEFYNWLGLKSEEE